MLRLIKPLQMVGLDLHAAGESFSAWVDRLAALGPCRQVDICLLLVALVINYGDKSRVSTSTGSLE